MSNLNRERKLKAEIVGFIVVCTVVLWVIYSFKPALFNVTAQTKPIRYHATLYNSQGLPFREWSNITIIETGKGESEGHAYYFLPEYLVYLPINNTVIEPEKL